MILHLRVKPVGDIFLAYSTYDFAHEELYESFATEGR